MKTRKYTKKPKYINLKQFLKAAIAEQISPDDIDAILDSIEQGLALSERDKAFAEHLESIGATSLPESDTSYNIGFSTGYHLGFSEAVQVSLNPPQPPAPAPLLSQVQLVQTFVDGVNAGAALVNTPTNDQETA